MPFRLLRGSAVLRGVLGVLQHPGPQFFVGPQFVGVISWLQVCKGPASGTAPGPALALMRPCSGGDFEGYRTAGATCCTNGVKFGVDKWTFSALGVHYNDTLYKLMFLHLHLLSP